MKTIILWFALLALMIGLCIYARTGFVTLALCFLAWCGGVVSTLVAQVLAVRSEESRARGKAK